MITYDDFAKLEFKVGKILEATDHPNADKLLVLKVDVGDKSLQMIAGVKGFYAPQDLIGKYVAVLANLEPRPLRGVESQGMVLAASTADKTQLCFVVPDKEIAVGSVIK
jgi:methionyl-tRNA synthetase